MWGRCFKLFSKELQKIESPKSVSERAANGAVSACTQRTQGCMWRSRCLHLNPKPYPNPLMKFHWDPGYVGSDQQTSLDLSWFKWSQGTSLLLMLRCHYVIYITWGDRSLQFTQEILKRSSNTSSYLLPNNRRTTRSQVPLSIWLALANIPNSESSMLAAATGLRNLQDLPDTHTATPKTLRLFHLAWLPIFLSPFRPLYLGNRVFVAHYGAQSTRLQHPIPGAWNLWCLTEKRKHDSEMMMSHSIRVVSFCYLS